MTTSDAEPDSGTTRHGTPDGTARVVWRAGWVLLAVVACGAALRFVVQDGGSVIFTVLMSWFASIAMEPFVRPLSRRMRRGAATGIVMLALAAFSVLFVVVFGQLLVSQVASLVRSLPSLVQHLLDSVSSVTGTEFDVRAFLSSLSIDPSVVAKVAGSVLASAVSLLASVLGSVFGLFTFGLFTFYLSADGPRLRLWIASLFAPRLQTVVTTVWDVTAEKTGSYVLARVVLASINASTSAVVFFLIGMPSWLALAIWTGLVAQFVPTVGTYISIILPVIVGLLSPEPWIGVAALVWAIAYQQVENLTIEPRISARAVDVHPAVAFGSVMLGAALFGAAGALLAIPVVAMILSLLDIYQERYALVPELTAEEPPPRAQVRRRRRFRLRPMAPRPVQAEAAPASASDGEPAT